MNIHRRDLEKTVDHQAIEAGWEGYAQIEPVKGELRVYLRVDGDPMLYPLPMTENVALALRPDRAEESLAAESTAGTG